MLDSLVRRNVTMVHQDPQLPSARIRIISMVPHLASLGWDVRLVRYGTWGELERPGDVVVLQKKLPSFLDARRFARLSVPLVFDFDDAVMFRDREKRNSYVSPTRRRRFDRLTKIADAFICGNEYLASQLPSDAISVIAPSPVPHEVPQRVHAESRPLRVAWVGLSQNLRFLRMLEDVWPTLDTKVRLVVVSNEPFETSQEVEYLPWSVETQHDALATCDVGVMPLDLDSPWTRGKCAYKALQYMAAGLPVVASDVGMNRDVITNGIEGFLATDVDSWVAAFSRLGSVNARRTMGAAGRRRIERTMTYPVIAKRWAELLERVRAG